MNTQVNTHSMSYMQLIRASVGTSVVVLGLFGALYCGAAVGIGQLVFPAQSNGSVIEQHGQIVGSALVAQPFSGEQYFHPRPSAAAYNPMAMSGSNQALSNPDLQKRVAEARQQIAAEDGVDAVQVPSDLITQSGSGMDPDISPAAATLQVKRVAAQRGVSDVQVEKLVQQYTRAKQFGVLGEPRVNVLQLNLALDQQYPVPQHDGVRGTGVL